jgi:hypothetical protein
MADVIWERDYDRLVFELILPDAGAGRGLETFGGAISSTINACEGK